MNFLIIPVFTLLCYVSSYSGVSKMPMSTKKLSAIDDNKLRSSDENVNSGRTTEQSNAQIFVCTNKFCREKGSDATMAAFTFLTPEKTSVVSVNCLGRCNKGPNVRILTSSGEFVEASMVRSVETVVDLLQTHLKLQVNVTSAEVLRLNYEGNVNLRSGNVDEAIDCYDRALDLRDKEQEGVLLVMRGTALLQRAYSARLRYKDIIAVADRILPTAESIGFVFNALSCVHPLLKLRISLELMLRVDGIFNSLDSSPMWAELKNQWPESKDGSGGPGQTVKSGEEMINKAVFAYSLYEYSLLRALSDLLKATLVLPGFAQAWRRAGDALVEMRLYRPAIEYYDVAVRLDEALGDVLLPAIERLKLTERFVENAEAKGWPIEAVMALIEE